MAGLLPELGTVRARKQPRLLSGCDHSPALISHPGQPAFHLPHQSPSPATALLCTSSGLLTPFSQCLFLLPFCRFQCTRRDRRFVACVEQVSINECPRNRRILKRARWVISSDIGMGESGLFAGEEYAETGKNNGCRPRGSEPGRYTYLVTTTTSL